jgi:hypothetical protein
MAHKAPTYSCVCVCVCMSVNFSHLAWHEQGPQHQQQQPQRQQPNFPNTTATMHTRSHRAPDSGTEDVSINAQGLSGTDGFIFSGFATGSRTGWRVLSCDINGDGRADIVTSAPWASAYSGRDTWANTGHVYVVFGIASGTAWPSRVASDTGPWLHCLRGGCQ